MWKKFINLAGPIGSSDSSETQIDTNHRQPEHRDPEPNIQIRRSVLNDKASSSKVGRHCDDVLEEVVPSDSKPLSA